MNLKEILPKRTLHWQVAFTLFVFAAMVIISYFIMSTTIRVYLSQKSEAALNLAIARIDGELRGPETTLRAFAETAQQRILYDNADVDAIWTLLVDLNRHLLVFDEDEIGYGYLFGIFYTLGPEPIFLHGSGWKPPADYDPPSRPWHQAAIAGGGRQTRSPLYRAMSTDQYVFAIAQAIYDESGRLLAVVCIQVPIRPFGKVITEMTAEQGGYGMILGNDLKVYAHPNPDFIGMEVPDPKLPFSIFHEHFMNGEDVFEHPITSFSGESSLAFFRKTPDGWYYGAVVPEAPYYKSIVNIWFALVALGLVSAVFLILILVSTDSKKNRATMFTNALNKMSEIFLTQSGKASRDIENEVGHLLADLAAVDRFSLYVNTIEDGILFLSQIYRWDKASGGTTKPNERFVHQEYRKIAPGWERMFKEGRSLNGPTRLMPEHEAALFKNLGTRSAFIAPININGVPWGFVSFEDQKKERTFDKDLAETMQSAAFLFANAIMRTELESQLASERDFTQKIIDAAPMGLNIWDENFKIIGCNDAIETIFGCTKQYYSDHFLEFSPEFQSDGTRSAEKAKELLGHVHIGETVPHEWIHCSAEGEMIPCEVTQTNVVYNDKPVAVVYIHDLRKLKKMEKAILNAEQTQTLIDAVPLSCLLVDKNLNVLTCNKTAIELFKLSKKEDIQRLLTDLIPEYQPDGSNSGEVAAGVIQKAFDEGYVFYADWTHQDMNGELFPCEVTLVRVEYGGDQVVAAYTRDLRAVREAEAKLREADESAQLMIENTPLVTMVWAEDLHILDCNQHSPRIFGLSTKKEYIDKFYNLLPKYQPYGTASADVAQNAIRRAFSEGYSRIEEVTMNHAVTGEAIPFAVSLFRIRHKGKNTVLSYGMDLRERNAAIAKMREADERTQMMFDVAPFAGCMFKKDFNMIDCNQALVKMFGIPDKEYFIKRHTELFPEYQPNGALSIEEAAENIRLGLEKGFHQFECMHRKLSGEPLPVIATFVRVKYRGEDVLASYFTDLTEQKAMIQLAKQQAEAEAASHAKSSFLATMSHEMRTPMNAIIGMTTIGKNSDDIERKDYALHKIEDAAVHLLSVINDVLDISKIEANKLDLSPVEFNYERMLQKIVDIINFRMDEKHQKFNVHVDRKIPRFVIGDDHRLSQVILNLLSNAVKFSPEQGEIGLSVALVGEQDGICEIRTEVSDNGIGIPPEQQEKLFQAFQQADSGISREFGGTGLGLSISKHIVELMGGTIWIESAPGEGSRFIFTTKVERGTKNITAMLSPGIKWDNVRILIVDDEPEVNAYFKDLLGQLGLKCDTAADGFEAYRAIEESGAYDIYFIDWRMPGMDGIELTRKIKAHMKDRPSVVVMISSADWTVIKDMALDAGVSKYLLKPLFSSAIVDCINECLGFRGAGGDETPGIDMGGRFAGKKLLLAEDVEINREIIMSLLEDTGITIECAQNGLEAVEMIVAAPDKYDVVLMDVQMPKMDGLEATRLIRSLTVERLKTLPIIAMTAHVFKSDIEECINAGMDDHIGKPIDIDDVLKKLHKYLHAPKKGYES